MPTKSKNIFLIDGLGALVSTICLIVLMRFESIFGMPKNYLFVFISIGSVFSIYSLACYFLNPNNWSNYLKLIAVSNLFYCGLTLFSVYQNSTRLTAIGNAYFLVESLIIVMLAAYELKMSSGK